MRRTSGSNRLTNEQVNKSEKAPVLQPITSTLRSERYQSDGENMSDNHQQNPYTSTAARYYAVGLLTVVYTFNFVDRQLLSIL